MKHPWMDTLKEVYLAELAKLYHVEKKLTEALSRNRERAAHRGLKQILGSHLDRTSSHSELIEEILKSHKVDPQPFRDEFIEQLIAKSENTGSDDDEAWLHDATMIASAHKIQNYQIAAYRTMTFYAGILGLYNDRKALHNIQCEKEFDDCKLHGHVLCGLGGPSNPWEPPDKPEEE